MSTIHPHENAFSRNSFPSLPAGLAHCTRWMHPVLGFEGKSADEIVDCRDQFRMDEQKNGDKSNFNALESEIEVDCLI